jgi:hypothetical protein
MIDAIVGRTLHGIKRFGHNVWVQQTWCLNANSAKGFETALTASVSAFRSQVTICRATEFPAALRATSFVIRMIDAVELCAKPVTVVEAIALTSSIHFSQLTPETSRIQFFDCFGRE